MRPLLFILVLCAPFASAKDVYISESGTGSQDGLACSSAHSMAWFNDQSNWSQTPDANRIAWGDTVHLCGTITSQVSFTGAGNGGVAYTLKGEPGHAVEAGVFTGNGWYHANGRTYFTYEDLIVRCTNSGSPGQGLTSTNGSSPAFGLISCNNVVWKNCTISNIYVRAMGPATQGGSAITVEDQTGANGGVWNMMVSNCVISHATIGAFMDFHTSTNFIFYGNTISNVNWGIGGGGRSAGSILTNLIVANNRIWAFTNWDGTSPASQGAFHHNAVYFYTDGGGTILRTTYYGNNIGPYFNAQSPDSQATSGIFFSGAGVLGPMFIYNNLFQESALSEDSSSDGMMTLGGAGVWYVLNNTCVSGNGNQRFAISLAGLQGNQTFYVSNNLVSGKSAIRMNYWTAGDTASIDYNIGYNLPVGLQYSQSPDGNSSAKTIGDWQALGFDTHGATNQNPNLTSTFRLNAGSPAIGAAVAYNSLFTTDYTGATRGATWDAGVFEYIAPAENPASQINIHGQFRVGTIIVVP